MSYGSINSKCGKEDIYTNEGDCKTLRKPIIALLVSGLNAVYPTDEEEFKQGFEGVDGYLYTQGKNKLIPITPIAMTAQNGGDAVPEDVGYGETSVVTYNPESNVYRINAGECLYKELVKYNGKKVRIFEIDQDLQMFGTAISETEQRGYLVELGVRKVRATATTSAHIELTVYNSVNYINEDKNANMINLDRVPEGFIPVKLIAGSEAGSAKVIQSCDGVDITAMYGTDWDTSMFVNRTGVNPTSVSYVEDGEYLTIQPAGDYRVANADKLFSGGIEGVSGVNKFATITAIV